jgi:hypothetical protein
VVVFSGAGGVETKNAAAPITAITTTTTIAM